LYLSSFVPLPVLGFRSTPGKEVAFLVDHRARPIQPDRDVIDVAQRLDPARHHFIRNIAVAERAVVAVAPGVDLAFGTERGSASRCWRR